MKEEIIEKIIKELREADVKMSEYIYAFIKSMKKDRKNRCISFLGFPLITNERWFLYEV